MRTPNPWSHALEWLWLSLIFLFLSGMVTGCDHKVNSPFSTETQTNVRRHNDKVIEGLVANDKKDLNSTVRIGILTDSHLNYEDLRETIKALNSLDLDFVVHLGDFTDLGLASEYDEFVEILGSSTHPTLVVVGNHDSIGAGPGLYLKIFGDYNVDFEYAGRRFALFNTNVLEYPASRSGYDPEWMKRLLQFSPEPLYVFQHVNFTDPVYFSEADQKNWMKWLGDSQALKMLINGHNHSYKNEEFGDVILRFISEVKGVHYATLEVGPTHDTLSWCDRAGCDPVSR